MFCHVDVREEIIIRIASRKRNREWIRLFSDRHRTRVIRLVCVCVCLIVWLAQAESFYWASRFTYNNRLNLFSPPLGSDSAHRPHSIAAAAERQSQGSPVRAIIVYRSRYPYYLLFFFFLSFFIACSANSVIYLCRCAVGADSVRTFRANPFPNGQWVRKAGGGEGAKRYMLLASQ